MKKHNAEARDETLWIERTNPFRFQTPKSQIVQLKRKTKRKPATMTITIPDVLAEKLLHDEAALCVTTDVDHQVTALRLQYSIKQKGGEKNNE